MLLLDTNALLWLWAGNARLGAKARQAIDRALQDGSLAASAMSFWEVAMLRDKQRLRFVPDDVGVWRRELLSQGLVEIPIDGDIAARAGALRHIHGDPADRLIVATALAGHQLVTSDVRILQWPGALHRLDARE